MHLIKKLSVVCIVFILMLGCNQSTKVEEPHSHHKVFETLEHAVPHMTGGPVKDYTATATSPGPKVGFEHTRLDVSLPATTGGYGGYIHFVPDEAGEMVAMSNIPITVAFYNGGVELEIEQTITAKEIQDSVGTSAIQQAWVFDAPAGDNVIKIGPVTVDSVKIIVEELGHGHL